MTAGSVTANQNVRFIGRHYNETRQAWLKAVSITEWPWLRLF